MLSRAILVEFVWGFEVLNIWIWNLVEILKLRFSRKLTYMRYSLGFSCAFGNVYFAKWARRNFSKWAEWNFSKWARWIDINDIRDWTLSAHMYFLHTQRAIIFIPSDIPSQVCEWQQPLVDWQTPSLTKKKDGEMIQL